MSRIAMKPRSMADALSKDASAAALNVARNALRATLRPREARIAELSRQLRNLQTAQACAMQLCEAIERKLAAPAEIIPPENHTPRHRVTIGDAMNAIHDAESDPEKFLAIAEALIKQRKRNLRKAKRAGLRDHAEQIKSAPIIPAAIAPETLRKNHEVTSRVIEREPAKPYEVWEMQFDGNETKPFVFISRFEHLPYAVKFIQNSKRQNWDILRAGKLVAWRTV